MTLNIRNGVDTLGSLTLFLESNGFETLFSIVYNSSLRFNLTFCLPSGWIYRKCHNFLVVVGPRVVCYSTKTTNNLKSYSSSQRDLNSPWLCFPRPPTIIRYCRPCHMVTVSSWQRSRMKERTKNCTWNNNSQTPNQHSLCLITY